MNFFKIHIYNYRVLLIAIIILHSTIFYSQDIHFSNWNMSPLNANPANAGNFDGDGRLIFNYRKQWKSVPVPYSTFSFGSDFNLKKPLLSVRAKSRTLTSNAVGLIFNHDAAGDGRYKINEVKVPFNTKINIGNDSTLQLNFALMAGFTNINIDANRLSYDKQWDGDIYNASLNNGESFNSQSKTFADVGLGTMMAKKFTDKLKVNIGYSINHLNKPNISFYNSAKVNLKPKHTELLQATYSLSNKAALLFEYYGGQQQKFKENMVGLSYYYTFNPKNKTIINAGALMRVNDAAITTIGLYIDNIKMQASYDYNFSQFKRATNGRGGFEISLIYIYAKPKIFVPKTRVCPVYM